MGYLLEAVDKWRELLDTYGEPVEIDYETAIKSDPKKVWTLWSRGSDFLANEIAQGPEVISYMATPMPWSAKPGSLSFVRTFWVDCPTCEENSDDDDWDQDDCEECEGSGVLSIWIPECLDMKTEDEIFESREA